jgi:ribonuclease D
MKRTGPDYEWVDTPAKLLKTAEALGRVRVIGVDQESDSLFHYPEKVCLVQLASEDCTFVLDPLTLKDLSPLRPLFADPTIRKVFHGADYDVRSLHRDFGFEVHHLFDTQLACQFLGMAETGLEAVLRSRFQVTLNKKFQRADWSKRPLSREMVEYASLDGRYLIPLARMLEKELKEKGRLAWVEEECRHLARVRFAPASGAPLFMKVKGAGRLDPRGLAVLETLLRIREEEALRLDIPPFKVLRNEVLLALAEKRPQTLKELTALKVMSPKETDRFGKILLNGIHRGMAVPEKELPRYPRSSPSPLPDRVRKRIARLKEWRERRAGELGLEPGILINNTLIEALAVHHPRGLKELVEVPGMKGWLVDHFGEELLQVLEG